jgi:hypothetical protein
VELIDIPDSYWTIEPTGFADRAADVSSQLRGVFGDVLRGAAPVLDGNDLDLRSGLALSDAAQPQMVAATGQEYNITAHELTGDMLSKFTPGDDLKTTADYATPPADTSQAPQGPPIDSPPAPPDDPTPPQTGPPPNPPPDDAQSQGGAPPPPAAGGPDTGDQAAPAVHAGPTFDQYTARMLETTGRPGSDYEWRTYWIDRPDWYDAIGNSDEAQRYAAAQAAQAQADAQGGYVTQQQLADHLSNLNATINIVV